MFESNMPVFFAPSEFHDYEEFLGSLESGGDHSKGLIRYYVVFSGGNAAACGGIGISPDGMKGRMIWGMVRADLHRNGLGREFLNFRIRRIRQLYPYAAISLDTTQHSKGFFERLGFETTKITPDFYAPGMDRYDMDLRSDSIF